MINHIICITILLLLFIYILVNKKESFTNKKYQLSDYDIKNNKKLPYCIVIPSHKPHFKYVEKLIYSMDKYCKEEINVYIVVSLHDYTYAKYFASLSSKILVTILCFKNIFNKTLNIDIEENDFLTYCGGYKFQSLKKITTVYYLTEKIKYEYVYVMDSEGLFIKPFSFVNLIENYKKNKRIFYNSKQRHNWPQSNISKQILNTYNIPGWFLENYLWIYEDTIVKDFWNYLFLNIQTYDDLDKIPKDVFIEIVYYHYIYINNYHYQFIDTYETMKPYLNKIDYYLNNQLKNLSLLEDIRVILNKENINALSNYFKDYSIQQTKIYENNENAIFLKKANILCINSGDFDLDFTMP